MNPRNTWLLVALAAGLFGFIWLIEPRLRPPPPAAPRVMPAFKAAEVTSIQIQPKNQDPFRVERTNGTWLMTKPLVYPVKVAAVDNFLHALGELPPRTRISGEELRKLRNVAEEYGFDSNQTTIILEFGDDKRTLHLGNRTAMGDELYTQLVGTDNVDVISTDFLKFVPGSADDWRDTTFVNLAGLEFDRLSVAHGGQTLELAYNATNKLWRMTKPAARADNLKIKALIDNLQNLRVNTFVTDNPAADLEPDGLQPPQSELIFGQSTNRLFSLQFGKSPTNDNNLVYARSNGQSTVVLLPKDVLAGWWAKPDEFRELHLFDFAAAPPDLIEVSGTNVENFTNVLLTNGWVILDAQKRAYAADPALMRDFLINLASLQVNVQGDGYTVSGVASPPLLTNYGLAPEPGRSYVLTHTVPPASTNEVNFGFPTDHGSILARRTGEDEVVAVLAKAVNLLPTRGLQLRLRQVWAFDAGEVTRLTIHNNGTNQVWDQNKPHEWDPTGTSYLVTDPRQASVGIEQAVINLGTLLVQSWVEPDGPNSTKYIPETDNQKIFLDVKRGDASKTFSIEFGKAVPLEEGGGIYARVPALEGGGNWTNWIVVYKASDVHNLLEWLPGLSR